MTNGNTDRGLDGCLVLCLSLPGSEDRRRRMNEQFDRLGVAFAFIDALRGNSISRSEALRAGYRPGAIGGAGELTPNEIACLMGHRLALSRFLQTEHKALVLLEDDAELTQDFPKVVTELLRRAECFDAIKLEDRCKRVSPRVGALESGHAVTVPVRPGLGATGFLYSRTGAQKVFNSLETFSVGVDTHLGRLWRYGFRLLQIAPPIVSERGELVSTIGHTATDGREGRDRVRHRLDRLQSSVGRRVFGAWLRWVTKRCLRRRSMDQT